jgi:hypothetical protein
MILFAYLCLEPIDSIEKIVSVHLLGAPLFLEPGTAAPSTPLRNGPARNRRPVDVNGDHGSVAVHG